MAIIDDEELCPLCGGDCEIEEWYDCDCDGEDPDCDFCGGWGGWEEIEECPECDGEGVIPHD